MFLKPTIVALDLEGVLIPEIWIALAEKTKIEKLRLTTRDIADYDVLMRGRLQILKENKLTLKDIQEVIASLEPLEGAKAFLDWLRTQAQVIILSDTYYEFAMPMMKKLGYPTLFCHSLEINEKYELSGYRLRIPDSKKKAVESFKALQFRVFAAGDSYNDTTMLAAADLGILFRPSEKVVKEFPQYPVFREYKDFQVYLEEQLKK